MHVLALSTSTEMQSLWLGDGDGVGTSQVERVARGQGRALTAAIWELCAGRGIGVADLELIVADVGPGSFTGLRLGLATARAIAWAHNVPTAPVGSLVAMVAAGRGAVTASPGRAGLAALPSRAGVSYLGLDDGAGRWHEDAVADGQVTAWLRERLPAGTELLTIAAAAAAADRLAAAVSAGLEIAAEVRPVDVGGPSAGWIALVALSRPDRAEANDTTELVPRYLSVSAAERHLDAAIDQRALTAERR